MKLILKNVPDDILGDFWLGYLFPRLLQAEFHVG